MPRKPCKSPPGVPKGTLHPQRWISGPDPERHRKYTQWLQQRNQAQWRGELWILSFEDWIEIWGDRFCERGRRSQDLCMTRDDEDDEWSKENTILMSRREHYQRNQQMSVVTRNLGVYKGHRNGKTN